MAVNQTLQWDGTAAGDAAVDGLLAGLLAGVAMGIFLVAMGALGGTTPAATLVRFSTAEAPVAGALLHLSVAGVYGALFGVVRRFVRIKARRFLPARDWGWVAGVAFGVSLWVLAQTVLLPNSTLDVTEIPPAHFAAAHAVYGLALSLALRRAEIRQSNPA